MVCYRLFVIDAVQQAGFQAALELLAKTKVEYQQRGWTRQAKKLDVAIQILKREPGLVLLC